MEAASENVRENKQSFSFRPSGLKTCQYNHTIHRPFSSARVSSCSLRWTISMRRRSSQCAPCRLDVNCQQTQTVKAGDTYGHFLSSRPSFASEGFLICHLAQLPQTLIYMLPGAIICYKTKNLDKKQQRLQTNVLQPEWTARTVIILGVLLGMRSWTRVPLPQPPLLSVWTARCTSSSGKRIILPGHKNANFNTYF